MNLFLEKLNFISINMCIYFFVFVLQTKEMEEKKEQIKILDEIITEYQREFSK